MKNDSIKKYLIPNIPYLFVLWAFLKLGTAYRLAAGAILLISSWGWARPLARPLPTLPRGFIPLTGSLVLWGLWRSG